jgi:hypothetical protein
MKIYPMRSGYGTAAEADRRVASETNPRHRFICEQPASIPSAQRFSFTNDRKRQPTRCSYDGALRATRAIGIVRSKELRLTRMKKILTMPPL